MAFSVYEVVRVACHLHIWIVNYVADMRSKEFVNAKIHARENCLQGISVQQLLWFKRSQSTRLSCMQQAFFAYTCIR